MLFKNKGIQGKKNRLEEAREIFVHFFALKHKRPELFSSRNGRCHMRKRKSLLIALGGLILLAGALAGVKGLQFGRMAALGSSFVPPPETVTARQVETQTWESVLTAVGSLQAVHGVVLTAEIPGKIAKIDFESGTRVEKGRLLVQQDISTELADLGEAETEVAFAQRNYKRRIPLLSQNVISKSDFDDYKTRYEKAVSRLENIKAAISKKTIQAPFTGRLGIRQVNPGEVIEIGQPIVSLQSLDPIYVNFLLPQDHIGKVHEGLGVRIFVDALKGREIRGSLTAVNAEVDSTTRNIQIQATLRNPKEELRPGMFANVTVVLPEVNPVMAIPITSVQYEPYGDSVFVIEDKKDASGKTIKAIRQQFVKLGEEKGDFVSVLSGLKPGDTVVTSGVFKLRNGQAVVVNNTDAPEFQLEPRPDNA
jgi:membrane fusion protein (multidrug efflux system)